MFENTNNPIFKLMVDNLQLVLIIGHFLNIKCSQGSVATRLRCGEIFSDQFVTKSLLQSDVEKKNLKIGRHLPKLKARLLSVVFFDSRCI